MEYSTFVVSDQRTDQPNESSTTNTSLEPSLNWTIGLAKIDPAIREIDDVASHYLTYKIAQGINMVFSPIVFPVGFVGNILLLFVLLRSPQHKASFFIYLSALAVNDCLVLLLGIMTWFATVVCPTVTILCCKTKGVIFSSTTSIRICLIFFITLDRYMAACHPFRFLNWRTRQRAVRVTGTVIVVCCLTAIPYALTSSQVNSFTCAGFLAGKLLSIICCFINLVCFGVLPLTAVLVMNAAISRYTLTRHMQFIGLYSKGAMLGGGKGTKASGKKCENNDTSDENRNHNNKANRPSSNPSERRTHEVKYGKGCRIPSTLKNIINIIAGYHSDINVNNNTDENANCQNAKGGSNHDPMGAKGAQLAVSTIGDGRLSGDAPPSLPASVRAADRQMARVLISITITLFVLVVPQLLRYVVFVFLDLRSSPATFAAYVLAYHISNKLCTANSAVNVFLYCLSGAQFRRQLALFLRLHVLRKYISKIKETCTKKLTVYNNNTTHGS